MSGFNISERALSPDDVFKGIDEEAVELVVKTINQQLSAAALYAEPTAELEVSSTLHKDQRVQRAALERFRQAGWLITPWSSGRNESGLGFKRRIDRE